MTITLLFVSSIVKAQLFCEDFEYATGDTLSNHGWVPFSGLGVNEVVVDTTGLEHACSSFSFGNSIWLTSTGEDSYRFLPTTLSSDTVYTSFLIKVTSAQSGDFFFHLGDSVVNNSNKIARVYIQASGAGYSIGLAKDKEAATYVSGFSFQETYLLILKYKFVPGENTNDEVSLFIISEDHCPDCIAEPPATIGPFSHGEDDLPNIGKLVICQGANAHGPQLNFDKACVDKVWCNSAMPVELTAFTSMVTDHTVHLNWSTQIETNNAGFEIERKLISENWSRIGYVPGYGTTTATQDYSFTDYQLPTGMYQYRLKQIDYNGNYEYFNLSNDVIISTPTTYELWQNYPNPFNPETKIIFSVPHQSHVQLTVYDISGKQVMTLVDETKNEGSYSVKFNAAHLSSGIYFYEMKAGNFAQTKKMTLVK